MELGISPARDVVVCASMALFGAAGLASTASGAVIESANYNQSTPYVVANNDLLQTSAVLAASAGNFQNEGSGGIGVLTDGAFGGDPSNAYVATAGNGHFLRYALDTVASPYGYTLTNINVYGGWNDAGRDQQSYTVAYSTVADPGTFVDLKTVNFQPPLVPGAPGQGGKVYTFVALSSDSGPLATNVAQVRFTFNATENGYSGYREIDVIGTASVPEPAAMALLGASALGLLHRRRRVR